MPKHHPRTAARAAAAIIKSATTLNDYIGQNTGWSTSSQAKAIEEALVAASVLAKNLPTPTDPK